jgi:hypothetical protein
MKKILTFIALFSFCLNFVSADVLPFYPNRNKLNIADYPEWTFFQKMRSEPQI